MKIIIEEIKDQILREKESLMMLEKDPVIKNKSVQKHIVERKLNMLRREAYEVAKLTDHPCPQMFLHYGEHEAKYGMVGHHF